MDQPIDFRSDNVGAVAPELLGAIAAANGGAASSYGEDGLTVLVQQRYSALFEREVFVFAVPTGTAANATCLSACTPPWGAIFCHTSAHAHTSECGATEFLSQGAKFVPVGGADGKIDAASLARAIAGAGRGNAHKSQPATLTLTQASEWGTVYTAAELDTLTGIARGEGLSVHMDGARFAAAVARLGLSPAEASWRRGVDILSFGVTKNGGLLCDAVIVFRADFAQTLAYRLRRTGYGWSKMRFAAAQLLAYVEDGLWLRLAERANVLASRLADGLVRHGATLVAPVQANEVFVRLPGEALTKMASRGILVQPRPDDVVRLVCRFDLDDEDIERAVTALAGQPS
jgi:threonine aldolase